MDLKKIVMTRRIEKTLGFYEGFYDHEWALRTGEKVDSTSLEPAFNNLCVAWKDASNTHRLPWLMITQMEAFVRGYVKDRRPSGMRLIDLLKIRLRRDLGNTVRNMAIKRIEETLDTIDRDFREDEKKHDVAIEPQGYWNMLVDQSEFQSSICGSQTLAYCGLVFAYEWFVVRCFRLLGGSKKAKPNDDKFWAKFREMLGRDLRPDYWDHKPIKIARQARNCIAHTGGEVKKELLDESPELSIIDGVITIQPFDTSGLYGLLKEKVTRLIDEVLPKLA